MADFSNTTRSANENDILKNMTYDDYLSSVYSYEETCAEAMRAQAELNAAKAEVDRLNILIEPLRQKDKENREQYNSLVTDEIARRRELWKKNQSRFDFKLSNRKAVAVQTAKNDIQAHRDEYTAELNAARSQADSITKHLRKLDDSYDDLRQAQKKLENFSVKSFPPADDKALEMLLRSWEKNLLTRSQREQLDDNVDQACGGWIASFDELTEMEERFAKSEFRQKLDKGIVTRTVIKGLSNALGIIFGAAVLIVLLLLSLTKPSLFSAIFCAVTSALAMGGLFASAMHVARERIKQLRDLPVSEKVQLIAVFILGCTVGAFIGALLIAPNRGAAALICCALCAAANGMLLRRAVLTELASKHILSKLPFLQDRARRELFEEYESKENGLYDFMIFCYLRHSEVLTFLSMQYRQAEVLSIQEKIDFNRKDLSYSKEQLEGTKKRISELKGTSGSIDEYEKTRNEQLAQELERIEAERPTEPNFAQDARAALAETLAPLDKEHTDLLIQLNQLNAQLSAAEDDLSEKSETAAQLKTQKRRIASALRSWTKTPMPASTDYTLLDSFCLDTGSVLRIIHHGCAPYVLRCTTDLSSESASKALALFIYRCIRGLCKINPRRIMQINIFDYTSNPASFIDTQSFKKLSKRGVIEGIYSLNEFEIRLFSNNEGYNTFKSFFRMQCDRVRSWIKENIERFEKGARPDLAMVNRLNAVTGELFLYQVCIFVVPRDDEGTSFKPPKVITELIEKGIFFRLGILPIFIADSESVSPEWKLLLDKYKTDDHIYPLG